MTETTETTEAPTYEKGSWQEALQKSSNLLDRSTKAKKTASALLWKGAREGIEGWLPESATDVSGEGLYNQVMEALGTARKGDASKIKTVAVAVRNHGLDLAIFPNLSKAYAEARALTTVKAQHDNEDAAIESAIEAIEAPKTTSSVEGAAAILLSKGVQGAVVAILDALGAKNEEAHKAFMREVSVEIAARVQANKPKPVKKATAPKGAATPAKKAAAKKAAAPVAVKGKPKGKPVAAKPEPVEEIVEDVVEDTGAEVDDDLLAEVEAEDNAVTTPEVPVKKVAAKGKPVVRRPSR